MPNFTNICYGALRDIGCLRPGQSTSPDVLNDCRDIGNQMIDSWQIDGLMVYAFTAYIHQLVAGQQTYTIGPTGNFTAGGRPTGIQDANIILNTTNPVVRRPCELINVDQWAALRVRDIPFAIPTKLYYDNGFSATGDASINLWPGPLESYQLEIFQSAQLRNFADLTTVYLFPPGYEKAIRKCLAMEIAPAMEIYNKLANLERPRPALLQLVAQQAQEALYNVKSYNAPEPLLVCDGAFRGSSKGGAFNYMTGDPS